MFNKKKTFLALMIIVAMVLTTAITGCSNQNANTEQEEPSVAFVAGYSAPVIDWDPSIIFSVENQVFFNFYETLLKYDANNDKFEYVLATDYTKSDDGLVWTFKLREGVKFHDGTDFNAEAVKFSIERTKNGKKGASYIWDPLKEINVIDDYTVEFVLSQPAPMELMVSCSYASFMMSPKSVGNDFAAGTEWFSKGNEAGTGPYMIQSQVQGDEVVLTKFKDYWRGWEGNHFDKVVFKLIGENASRRQMLESGEADVVTSLMAEDIEALKDNPNVQIIVSDDYSNLLGFMNTEKAPLNNKLVRQAMAYAFPYEDVVNYVRKGYASVATDIIPSNLWGANEKSPYTHDLEKAKELLAQAGYPDGGLTIKYTYIAGVEDRKKTAELFKGELAKIGVTLDIQGMPWDSEWELAKSPNPEDRQDICSLKQWADLISPVAWYQPMIHSEDTIVWNLSYYKNPEVDKLIEDAHAMTAIDMGKAGELFKQAGKIVAEDCPILYLGDEKAVMLLNKSFKGYTPNPAYKDIVFFYDCYREKEAIE